LGWGSSAALHARLLARGLALEGVVVISEVHCRRWLLCERNGSGGGGGREIKSVGVSYVVEWNRSLSWWSGIDLGAGKA
jgi:hypothetical protein